MNVRTAFMMTIAVSTPLWDVARWLELLGSRSKKHMTTAAGVGHTHTHAHNNTDRHTRTHTRTLSYVYTHTRENTGWPPCTNEREGHEGSEEDGGEDAVQEVCAGEAGE